METNELITYLKSTKAIREQCGKLMQLAEQGKLNHFEYRADRLAVATDYVLQFIRAQYPTFQVPYHSRWRHFDAQRLSKLDESLANEEPEEKAKSKIELAILSVLLDAGAGMKWRYQDSSGISYKMSEGLATASFDMFLDGAFSAQADKPFVVDTVALKTLDAKTLAGYFQVTEANPLQGFEGRLQLIHKLGQAVSSQKKVFGEHEPRLGNILDSILRSEHSGQLPATAIFNAVIEGLGSIWPGRIVLGGVNLGDVWTHSALSKEDKGAGLVPFHKLSQWLTYSLVEPLEELGLTVKGLDQLTGLAEYRNGGLFVDLEVLKARDPAVFQQAFKPDSELVVEWRALTLCLLDRVAEGIQKALGLSSEQLPLAKVLQGGTWSAGRKIAAEKRADGGPPIRILSDGTVF